MLDTGKEMLQILYVVALLSIMILVLSLARVASKRRNSEKKDLDFLGSELVNDRGSVVPDGATATNFQLLTVFPNVTFGMAGLIFIPLINILGYFFGILLTRGLMRRFLISVANAKTPHNFIAISHGADWLRNKTAWVSLISFTATICFEVVWLSRICKYALGATDASYYTILTVLVITLLIVPIVGGQEATLAGDIWLLVLSYFGFHIALGYMVSQVPIAFDLLSSIIIVFLFVMLIQRIKQTKKMPTAILKWRQWMIVASTLILFLSMIDFKGFKVNISPDVLRESLLPFTPSANGIEINLFIMIVVASISPVIFYNFIDFGFWQKYLAEYKNDEDHLQAGNKVNISTLTGRLKESIWLYVIESPLSWLLTIILGVYMSQLVPNVAQADTPINSILSYFSAQNGFGSFIATLFFASVAAIAVSTVCGYFANIGYLIEKDIRQEDFDKDGSLAPGAKYLMFLAAGMLIMLILIDITFHNTDQLIALMLTSFAPLCAITPLVIYPLLAGSLSLSKKGQQWVFTIFLLASAIGVVFGLMAAILNVSPRTYLFWLSMPSAFIISWLGYLLVVLTSQESTNKVHGVSATD